MEQNIDVSLMRALLISFGCADLTCLFETEEAKQPSRNIGEQMLSRSVQ